MPELVWNGKEAAVKAAGAVPYRLLVEDRELSFGADAENMLIQGDNLAALKALLPYYKGQVRCVYAVPHLKWGVLGGITMKMSKNDKYEVKVLEKRIANGDLEAMMEYAQMFQCRFQEEVTDTIAEKIVKCYETCLEAGNLTAALNLGAMYYGGEFIQRDFKKAIHYYEMATASDDEEIAPHAWSNLGYCYYYGRDIPVDDEKAFNCYMHAAIQHDANALYKIGDMYRYGRFVKKDENMAVLFYQQAMDETYEGDPTFSDIAKRIGECALYGIGMEKDIYLAMELLTKAELITYKKIRERDPFAASLLPKIQQMLKEAKSQVQQELDLLQTRI